MNEMTVKESGGIANIGQGQSVLGETRATIPIGGRVRSGIMVLTPTGKKNAQAVKIYDKGIKEGKSFKDIARELKPLNQDKSLLMPSNAGYFTVRQGDFNIPGAADFIMDNFAAEGPDGYQLYRFPVIFPVDNWQAVIPHEFACFTGNEKVYWSEYNNDGQRVCMTREKVKVEKGKAHRPAGGRRAVLRCECNPDECAEYQTRKCTLSGRFVFFIPGLPGARAVDLPTRSIYSLMAAKQQLDMVAFITGGKISGMHEGRPIFWLSKKKEDVSMIDPKTGKASKVPQWLISLDADINMSKLYEEAEAPAMLSAGEEAAAALGHNSDSDDAIDMVVESVEQVNVEDVHDVSDIPADVVKTVPGVPAEAAEIELLETIEAAKSTDDLMPVAEALPGIKDAEGRKRVQLAMADRYQELSGGQS